MVLNREGLPRSAAEALGFFFGLKNLTAVNAPGTEISIDLLPRVAREIDTASDFLIMPQPP
jgi:hypothetical protein